MWYYIERILVIAIWDIDHIMIGQEPIRPISKYDR